MVFMEIGLSLGSNLGDRLLNLSQAREMIAGIPGLRILASSPVYTTAPVDVPPEFADLPFLNAVLVVSADVGVENLFDQCASIEKTMGRQQGAARNSPRPIDIDIIFAGTIMMKSGDGGIPHPRWVQRRFVVQPLADIRPDLLIPGESRTVMEVLLTLPPTPKVVLFLRNW
jgi:2-amino-4-hydroxy-6-hydroxymethyldihydropteridine diphosphokinase